MTLDELRADFETIKKTLQRERKMRETVLKGAKLDAGLAEIDQSLAALIRIKDQAKHCIYTQPPLIVMSDTRQFH